MPASTEKYRVVGSCPEGLAGKMMCSGWGDRAR